MLGWMLVVAGWAQELGEEPSIGDEWVTEQEISKLTELLAGTDAERRAYLHLRVGELHLARGRDDEALAAFRAAARLVSGTRKVEVLERISVTQERKNDLDGSIETTQQIILLSDVPEAQLTRLASLYVRDRRQPLELHTYLSAAPRSVSSDPALVARVLSAAAAYYVQQGSFEEGLSLLEPLLAKDPSVLADWMQRFYALTRLGRTDLTAELTALGAAFPGPYRGDDAIIMGAVSQLLLTQGWREDAPESARLALDLWLARFPEDPQAPEVASRRARLSAGG